MPDKVKPKTDEAGAASAAAADAPAEPLLEDDDDFEEFPKEGMQVKIQFVHSNQSRMLANRMSSGAVNSSRAQSTDFIFGDWVAAGFRVSV